eukprot:scaffold291253_cov31-Tisochrysis_lutea.AAC.6
MASDGWLRTPRYGPAAMIAKATGGVSTPSPWTIDGTCALSLAEIRLLVVTEAVRGRRPTRASAQKTMSDQSTPSSHTK